MIVPESRLLWAMALILVPLAAAGGLVPGFAGIAVAGSTLIVTVAILDAMLSRRRLEGLEVDLPPTVRMVEQKDALVDLSVHNRPAKALRLRLAFAFPDGIAAENEEMLLDLEDRAERFKIPWKWSARRRGHYRLDRCYLERRSRLGLWAVRGSRAVDCEIRVYPTLQSTGENVAVILRGGPGAHALRQVGKGRDFEKLREYIPGDSFDEIHWKATARRGHPITKVFQVERTQEVYVVIDTSRLSERLSDGISTLERYIQAGLLLAIAAQRQGDRFGLVTFSNEIHGFLRARSGKAHYGTCRDMLYALRARPVSPDFDELATFLRLRLRRRALLIFLTSLDDPVLMENFSSATGVLSRQHLLLANMLRPANARPLFSDDAVADVDDVYARLGGHLVWHSLSELEATLRVRGVRFTLLGPDTLNRQLNALYREVKQRQLL